MKLFVYKVSLDSENFSDPVLHYAKENYYWRLLDDGRLDDRLCFSVTSTFNNADRMVGIL